jgi:serine/threonine protein kinase
MIIIPGVTVFGLEGTEYEVLEYINSGSFGAVYKVKERQGVQILAMKTIPTSFTDETALKTFVNEGNLAVGIRHPNVIEYIFFHDGAKHSGLPPYILMEYAEGGTLENQIEKAARDKKPFSGSDLLAIFKQLVAGMKVINEKLVHRDIKPDNILICKNNFKISDFGLSKVVTEATRKSSFKGFGCIQYMAPEAWRFEKNTVQLDIYSMGIVFYQLATLRHPFDIQTADPRKWMDAHLFQPISRPDIINPSIGSKLSQVIIRMIEKDSSKRFKTWNEIEALLDSPEVAPSGVGTIVEKMLQKRLQQDSAAQAAEAEERRKKDAFAQHCKLVLSQVEKVAVLPLIELVAEFNRQYPGNKAHENYEKIPGGTHFNYSIGFPSQRGINVFFQVLLERDFIREIAPNWQYMRPHNEVCIPTFKGRRVQGWGNVQGSDGRGFNILLVERPNEIYGDIVMMLNRMGFPSNAQQRPDPFAFELRELEHELQLIDAMHIYKTNTQDFDIEYLREFVANYV